MTVGENIVEVTTDTFREEVIGSTLPVLVEFYADWCPLCRAIEPALETLAREYSGRVKFVRVNTSSNKDVASIYRVERRPTIFLIREGRTKEILVGVNPEVSYRRAIDKVLRA